MEILSFSTVDLFYRAFCSDGDMFPFANRALVEVFIRIEPDGIHIFLAITAVESHFSPLLDKFLFSLFKSRDIDEVVIGSHSDWGLKIKIHFLIAENVQKRSNSSANREPE